MTKRSGRIIINETPIRLLEPSSSRPPRPATPTASQRSAANAPAQAARIAARFTWECARHAMRATRRTHLGRPHLTRCFARLHLRCPSASAPPVAVPSPHGWPQASPILTPPMLEPGTCRSLPSRLCGATFCCANAGHKGGLQWFYISLEAAALIGRQRRGALLEGGGR